MVTKSSSPAKARHMRERNSAISPWSYLVMLSILTTGLAACGEDEVEEGRDLKIAWISKGVNNIVFSAGRQGAFASARDISIKGPDRVSILYHPSLPVEPTFNDQLPVLRQAIDARVDGIGISATDATALDATINEAVAAGIKVMTWDSDAPASERFTYLGVDNREGGRLAAKVLARALQERGITSGNLVITTGNSTAANLNERVIGFQEGVVAINSELQTSFDASRIYYCNEDGDLQAAIMEATLGGPVTQDNDNNLRSQEVSAVPELRGFFLAGAWALFLEHPVLDRWKVAPQADVLTVAFDTVPKMLEHFSDGYVVGLIGQKYWGWGYDTVQMIYEVIRGNATYDRTWTDSGIDVICTNEGATAMSTMWTTYGFTEELPPCELAR